LIRPRERSCARSVLRRAQLVQVEKINGPFLFELKGTPAEYMAGLERDRSRLAGAA